MWPHGRIAGTWSVLGASGGLRNKVLLKHIPHSTFALSTKNVTQGIGAKAPGLSMVGTVSILTSYPKTKITTYQKY